MRNQKGFSLLELLIVVAIIGIIAAMAIPKILGAPSSKWSFGPVIVAHDLQWSGYLSNNYWKRRLCV